MIQTYFKRPLLITFAVLLIPLLASWFTEEMNWTLFDYVFIAVLIFGISLTYEIATKKGGSLLYRSAVGVALFASFLLLWINGAVGIIGSENNPANLLYLGVIMLGIIGAIVARLESHKMVHTMFMMAIAQFLVPIVALMIWKPVFSAGVVGVLILNFFFVVLFVISALLFKQASETTKVQK